MIRLLLFLRLGVSDLALLLTARLICVQKRVRIECRLTGQLILLSPLRVVLRAERGVAAIVVEELRVFLRLRFTSLTHLNGERVLIEIVRSTNVSFFVLVR